MAICPNCNENFNDSLKTCPICKVNLIDSEDFESFEENWVIVGRVKDQTTSEYARETLESYDIPAVIISESGFFGQAGLNLPSPSGANLGFFQIHVPRELKDEAADILKMILGDSWEKED